MGDTNCRNDSYEAMNFLKCNPLNLSSKGEALPSTGGVPLLIIYRKSKKKKPGGYFKAPDKAFYLFGNIIES